MGTAPAKKEHGAPRFMVLEACRAKAMDCPNRLMDPEPWARAVEDWALGYGLSGKLDQLDQGNRPMFHHRLKFSISGCPNGCSRPQIVDFGLRGRVWPRFDLRECTSCGACARACPDNALTAREGFPEFSETACQGCLNCSSICPAQCITLAQPQMELLIRGKLGRHPRLAQPAGLFQTPDQVIQVIQEMVDQYLRMAAPGQRFADFTLGRG